MILCTFLNRVLFIYLPKKGRKKRVVATRRGIEQQLPSHGIALHLTQQACLFPHLSTPYSSRDHICYCFTFPSFSHCNTTLLLYKNGHGSCFLSLFSFLSSVPVPPLLLQVSRIKAKLAPPTGTDQIQRQHPNHPPLFLSLPIALRRCSLTRRSTLPNISLLLLLFLLIYHTNFCYLSTAEAVGSVFGPFVDLVKSWNLPDWLVHWGHPANMVTNNHHFSQNKQNQNEKLKLISL